LAIGSGCGVLMMVDRQGEQRFVGLSVDKN
jgi:hypothetical protein